MTANEDLPLNGVNPSTSETSTQNGTFSSMSKYKNNGDAASLAHSNGNIRLRKDMSALQAVPIKIHNEKLLDAHGPRYKEDSMERFCPSNRMPRFYACEFLSF